MKIMISGSSGLLGQELVAELSRQNDVFAINKSEMDVTNLEQVKTCTAKYSPDIIINSSGATDVDKCQSLVEKAFKVNALGARNLALCANEMDCPILYLSTDYVFDGLKHRPYVEEDLPNPLNVYGMSKLLGEYMIKEMTHKNYIIRTAWLYGSKLNNNFVSKIIELSKIRETLTIVDDQIGSPTYVKDLARAIHHIIGSEKYGTYHVTNKGQWSWCRLAKYVLEYIGSNTDVIPIKSEQLNRLARRPSYSALKNNKLERELHYFMSSCEEALGNYFKACQ